MGHDIIIVSSEQLSVTDILHAVLTCGLHFASIVTIGTDGDAQCMGVGYARRHPRARLRSALRLQYRVRETAGTCQ